MVERFLCKGFRVHSSPIADVSDSSDFQRGCSMSFTWPRAAPVKNDLWWASQTEACLARHSRGGFGSRRGIRTQHSTLEVSEVEHLTA